MPDKSRIPESDYYSERAYENFSDGNRLGTFASGIAFLCGVFIYDIIKFTKNENEIKNIRNAVKDNNNELSHLKRENYVHHQVVVRELDKDPMLLEHVTDEWKKDPGIVLEAVLRDGSALEYASAELKADPEIVTAANMNNETALEFASEELQNEISEDQELDNDLADVRKAIQIADSTTSMQTRRTQRTDYKPTANTVIRLSEKADKIATDSQKQQRGIGDDRIYDQEADKDRSRGSSLG